LDEGLNAGISFIESGKGRQSHDSVCRQMVGLQLKVIQEVPEEIARWESEASLKVGDEDHPLICLRRRHSFAGR
jgi:hypothetical protein